MNRVKRTGKRSRRCDGCLRDILVRYRTLADAYLCQSCYDHFTVNGRVPDSLDLKPPPPRSW